MKTQATAAALALIPTMWLVPGEAQAAGVQAPAAMYQKQIFNATNQQRERHDRARFGHQDCVQRFAIRQARRMARQERMFHQDLRPILRRCGLSSVGENVAYGYPSGRSAVNQGWMSSEGHRANILNRGFRLLGVGARRDDDGTWYAAQVFGRR
jgi:uncharacterized protein YkwD